MRDRTRAVRIWLIALIVADFLILPGLMPHGSHTTAILTAMLSILHLTAGLTVAYRAKVESGWPKEPMPYRWIVAFWLLAETTLWVQSTWVWWIAPRQTPDWSQIGPRMLLLEFGGWAIWRNVWYHGIVEPDHDAQT